MLLESVVSMAIVVALLGAVFSLLDPAQGAVAAQPQAAEMQQRARAAFVELHRDLLMAGSGKGPGSRTALGWLRAPVVPGGMYGSASGAGRSEEPGFTLFYAPPGLAGAHLAAGLPAGVREVEVALVPGSGCLRPPRCGVDGPGNALVFGPSRSLGAGSRNACPRALGHPAPSRRGWGDAFPAGASIMSVAVRGYVLDRRRGQLRRHGGTAVTLPFVDGVVDLDVRYFGGPLRALTPASSVDDAGLRVAAPCLVAAAGGGRPAVPPPPSIRELPAAELVDGPWCGGSVPFDVDLFRVRRVQVTIRLRVPDDAWRGRGLPGPGPTRPSLRRGSVPDRTARFDVAPRALGAW